MATLSTSKKFFISGFFSLAFLALLALFLYTDSTSLKNEKQLVLQELRTDQFNYVAGQLANFLKNANSFVSGLTNEIRKKIYVFYKEHPGRSVAKDLENINSNNNPIVNSISTTFRGRWLNNVRNDNNDPWAVMTGPTLKDMRIVADLSVNCSSLGRTRSSTKELSRHGVPALGAIALTRINDMVNTGAAHGRLDNLTAWSYLHPVKPEYIVPIPKDHFIDPITLSALRQRFLEYKTLDVFASYEFLTAKYIEPDQDLAGRPVVTEHGFRGQAQQIAIVSGFNLVDQFNNITENKLAYQEFEDQIQAVSQRFSGQILLVQNLSLVLAIGFFLCFIGLTILEDYIISHNL